MMEKIKSLALWQKLLITLVVMALAGAAAYMLVATYMPPFTATATLTIDPVNLAEGVVLQNEGLDKNSALRLKDVSAGRPATGIKLTEMFEMIYGKDAKICPKCEAALPEDSDISKKITCTACNEVVDLGVPFKETLLKVTNAATMVDSHTILFTCQDKDAQVAENIVNLFVVSVDAYVTKKAPGEAQPNTLGEVERLPNTSPRTLLLALLAATLAGMACYMVFTTSAANVAFRKLMAYTLLVVLCVLCICFFYILFINASRAHSEIQSRFALLPGKFFDDNWNSLMADKMLPIWSGMLNSLVVSSSVALLSTYFSTLTAYAIHAYQFKMRDFAFKFILLVMMVPGQVSALGFVEMMNGWNWDNTFWPLIVPSIAAPAVFFFMKQYMESALPLAIVEAARIDGSSEFGTFNRIVLHIMKPAIAVQAIFTFVGAWNNYFTPALLLKEDSVKTLPILIATLRSADFTKFDMGKVYMMICLSILPVIVVYLCLSKFIIAGVAVGGVKE